MCQMNCNVCFCFSAVASVLVDELVDQLVIGLVGVWLILMLMGWLTS